jgi:F-type H+-transporting ATPase subunit c
MDNMTLIAIASIVTAGLTIALGSIGPALGEGRAELSRKLGDDGVR